MQCKSTCFAGQTKSFSAKKRTDLLQGSIQNRTACIRNLPFHSNVNEVIQYKLIFVSVDIIKLFGLTLTLISGNIKE